MRAKDLITQFTWTQAATRPEKLEVQDRPAACTGDTRQHRPDPVELVLTLNEVESPGAGAQT
jgi:hypothetical protein